MSFLKRQRAVQILSLLIVALPACSSEQGPPAASGGQAPSAGSGGTSGSGTSGGGGLSAAGAGAGGMGGANGGAAGVGGGAAGNCAVAKTDAEVPMLLSATGCVDMADPSKPAPGLVPYSVRSPLWSDAASKERFVRVPAGAKIHALDCAVDVDDCKPPGEGGIGADEGHWIMPVGTVLVKSFAIEGKRIETRLLMRRSNLVWKGFSYEWNDGGTDATLLPDNADGKDKPVGSGSQVWHYPSRGECLDCHTRYAGSSLGLSTAQLNSDYAYAEGSLNQVEKFKALGLFDTPPKNVAGYPDPAGSDNVETRARSYLQTNCAVCHRPGGDAGVGDLDLRFTTPFEQTSLCKLIERDMGAGLPNYRLVPGKPAESNLSARMHALDEFRMPKVGSNVLDAAGVMLIDDWISAMPTSACSEQP